MFKLLKLLGLGVALALLVLATGNVGQVSIAQSCAVVLRPGDSIQNAINNVSPNSVICLTENTWQENLTITKDNLTLRGQGPSRTFIIGSVLVQVAGRFTVENLTLHAQAQFGLANAPWPMFQHDPQHTGRSPYVGPASPTLKWRYERDSKLYYPAIGADGTIYVGSDYGYLYAISPDGKEKWLFDAGYSIRLFPSHWSRWYNLCGISLSFRSDGYLYAISPDGKEKWRFKTGYIGSTPPQPLEQMVQFMWDQMITTSMPSLLMAKKSGALRQETISTSPQPLEQMVQFMWYQLITTSMPSLLMAEKSGALGRTLSLYKLLPSHWSRWYNLCGNIGVAWELPLCHLS
jgi:hypothetical protein